MSESYWHDTMRGGKDLADAIFATVDNLQNDLQGLRSVWRRDARLYAGMDDEYLRAMGTDNDFVSYAIDALPNNNDRLSMWNVGRSITSALVSEMSLFNPAPKVQTTAAKVKTQRLARKIERIMVAEFARTKVHQSARKALRMAAVTGTAFLKAIPRRDSKRIEVEVYGPDKIIVDHFGHRSNSLPISLFHVDFYDKLDLISMFPKRKEEIERAPTVTLHHSNATVRKVVKVVEAWKRPLGGDGPGRHAIVIDDVVLLDEKYNKPGFPLTWIKYNEPLEGFYGDSLISELVGIQHEIDYVSDEMRGAIRHLAKPYLTIETGSSVRDVDVESNADYRIIEGGEGVNVVTPPIANNQIFDYLLMQYQKAFEVTGLSNLAAFAQVPAGLESGEAIRQNSSAQSRRFSEVHHSYEELIVETGKLIIDAGKSLGDDWNVTAEGKEFLEQISWKDIGLEKDEFVISVHPASALPNDPPGRVDMLAKLLNIGAIQMDAFIQLMGINDLAKWQSIESAPREDLEMQFERFLDGEDYEPPEDFQLPYLDSAIRIATSFYLRSRMAGADEADADKVLKWIDDAKRMMSQDLEAAQRQQQQQQGAIQQGNAAAVPQAIGQLAQQPIQ